MFILEWKETKHFKQSTKIKTVGAIQSLLVHSKFLSILPDLKFLNVMYVLKLCIEDVLPTLLLCVP